MMPLVGYQVACSVCEKREIHLFFMSLSDLDRHLDQHHTDARIQWGCYCERSFSKLHGVQCHIPKCSGGSSQMREGDYKCVSCSMSFGSQRLSSTHERHAHPALGNAKRRGAEPQVKFGV
jgi:hypothetical protein